MRLLREDWRAALHMATNKSITCKSRDKWITYVLCYNSFSHIKLCASLTNLCTGGNLFCSSRHNPQHMKGKHTQLPGANCWLQTHNEEWRGWKTAHFHSWFYRTATRPPVNYLSRARTLSMGPFWKRCRSSQTTQNSFSVGILCSAYLIICAHNESRSFLA